MLRTESSVTVGQDIVFFCTKCKLELSHVIVSMMGERPAIVLCKTCHTQRKYRRSSKKEKTLTASTKRLLVSSTRAETLWQERMNALKAKVPKKYRVIETFEKDDLIEHIQFGVGVVQNVIDERKIQVLFKTGEKVLAQKLNP